MSDFKSADVPWQQEFVKRQAIYEMMEGRQVARLEHAEGEKNPLGGALIGIETTDGQRFLIMAIPDFSEGSQSPWKLAAAAVADPNQIWSPSVTAHFTKPRKEKQGWLQERVEGEVIESMRLLPELSPFGGEQVMVTLKNAGGFLIRACPPLKGGRPGYSSNLGSASVKATYNPQYYTANRERFAQRRRKWRAANKSKISQWSRKYYEANREQVLAKGRSGHLKRKYGITQAQYAVQLAKQSGCCAICGTSNPGKPPRGTTGRFYVDHDHKTGKNRKLLCRDCNTVLGLFRDDPNRLRKAAFYLEEFL